MKAILRLTRRATYADYLAAEETSQIRHELIDGVVVAMAGGSDEHNAISSQLNALMNLRRRPGCRSFSPDQRFWIPRNGRGRYTDGSLVCGAPRHPEHDAQATTNPLVVVEVLSPSSEGDDEGDKREDFQSLASLRAYVLVAQDSRLVRVFRRDSEDSWRPEPDRYRDGDAFELPGLTASIPVAEIYQDILDADGRSLVR